MKRRRGKDTPEETTAFFREFWQLDMFGSREGVAPKDPQRGADGWKRDEDGTWSYR